MLVFCPGQALSVKRRSNAPERRADDNLSSPRVTFVGVAKVGRNEPCPCGSGKKFKRCHGSPGAEVHPRRTYQLLMSNSLKTCLDASGNCERDAIRAHSIQNSERLMGLLAEDGHVAEVAPRGQPPRLELRRVGRRRASTFAGLCAEHDAQIFRPLDTQPLDPENPEHRFLLAYRAVIREHYVLRRTEDLMKRANALPKLSAEPSIHYFADVGKRFADYRRRYFDTTLQEHDFESIESRVLEIKTTSATIAVSSLYSLDLAIRPDGDVARAALSVVPVSPTRSVAIVSYVPDDRQFVVNELAKAFPPKEDHAHELSRLILETSENFVLRPGFTEGWSREKTRKIIAAAGLLSVFHTVPSDRDLLMFDT